MLEPHHRRHLIETLRPPLGYRLDIALGTTFSLDLIALLTAPLAFTFFDWEGDGNQSRPTADPLALLEALRRNADRITIFCEAGQISVPQDSQLLFTYLEGSVFEAVASGGGAFHPKIWVLRFVDQHGAVAYRLLCLSRNLTFDRSWDTVLALDGFVSDQQEPQNATIPISNFLGALPNMVVRRTVPETVQERIALIQDELQHVQFELPAGFEGLVFHPIGVPGASSWPFGNHYDRLLVISPFVTAGCVERLAKLARERTLIARLEELQSLQRRALDRYGRIFTLSAAAEPEDAVAASDTTENTALVGLHAKLYVADKGDQAHIWTGSANATDAAFSRNVEFLVELIGSRQACGVDAVLGRDGETGLSVLLEPFDAAAPVDLVDELQQALETLADDVHRQIARLELTAQVVQGTSQDLYTIELQLPPNGPFRLVPHVNVVCWPVTRTPLSAAPVDTKSLVLARFNNLSFEAITSFFAFTVVAKLQGRTFQRHFVMNLPLQGAPDNRRERILRSLLQTRDQVLRFLLLLLSDDGSELSGLLQATQMLQQRNGASFASELFGLPLFEAMVRSLDRDPEKLDYIARLIDDLRKTPEGQQLLPDTFDSIWEPIRFAREALQP